MAITIDWDQVNGAELDQHVSSGRRIVRSGFVKGLTTSVTTPKLAMLAVMDVAGVPQFGETYDALYTDYRCVYRVVRGIESTGGRMARIFAHYETSQGGTPIETFAAEDSTTLSVEPVNVFPGKGTQLLCSLTSTPPNRGISAIGGANRLRESDRPITTSYPRAIRSLVLYGLFAGRPSLAVLGAIDCVNNATWQDLPIGYWRCESVRASYSNRDGLYKVTVGFLTRGDADWSSFEVPIDPVTGQLATPKDSVIVAEQGKAYTYGVMSEIEGLWHGGMYKTKNFSTIFGNSFPLGD